MSDSKARPCAGESPYCDDQCVRCNGDYYDEADDMCPNCVTPWKCNGPHYAELTRRAIGPSKCFV